MQLMQQRATELLHQPKTTQTSVDFQSIFGLIKAYLHLLPTDNSGIKGWFTEEHKDGKEANC
jgi:hypothetical protein